MSPAPPPMTCSACDRPTLWTERGACDPDGKPHLCAIDPPETIAISSLSPLAWAGSLPAQAAPDTGLPSAPAGRGDPRASASSSDAAPPLPPAAPEQVDLRAPPTSGTAGGAKQRRRRAAQAEPAAVEAIFRAMLDDFAAAMTKARAALRAAKAAKETS